MACIKKRTKKDGSVVYGIRVSKGYDRKGRQLFASMTYVPEKGMSAHQMEKEAKRQALIFEEKINGGLLLDSKMKLDELIDKWMREYAEKQLKPQTVYNYKKLVPRISAAMGHLRIQQIRPTHIMQFYSNLEEDHVRLDSTYLANQTLLNLIPLGQHNRLAKEIGISWETMRMLTMPHTVALSTAQKVCAYFKLPLKKAFTEQRKAAKLNHNSIHHYHRFLSSVFSSAVRWQLMESNPCTRVSPPKAEEVDVQFLDEKQVSLLLKALEDAPVQYGVIVQLALFTGCRRGEVCGLRWSDIDLENGTLSVARSLTSIPKQGQVFSTPKTKRSRRTIKIEPNTVQLLRDYKRYQAEERFKVGTRWAGTVDICGKTVENDLLFTSWDGNPIDPGALSSWFPDFLRKHGLPAVHFHSLRHTNASLLIAAHVPIVTVAGRLGHAQASTTANIYADMIHSSDAAAADELGSIFTRIKEDAKGIG